ncbi:MAG: hypothetical protein KA110_10715 [Acidimicrobiia bacterium]|nr:hypothetical protein [Acidimicrobiia bacterium]
MRVPLILGSLTVLVVDHSGGARKLSGLVGSHLSGEKEYRSIMTTTEAVPTTEEHSRSIARKGNRGRKRLGVGYSPRKVPLFSRLTALLGLVAVSTLSSSCDRRICAEALIPNHLIVTVEEGYTLSDICVAEVCHETAELVAQQDGGFFVPLAADKASEPRSYEYRLEGSSDLGETIVNDGRLQTTFDYQLGSCPFEVGELDFPVHTA